jgi:hypothetical protein
MNKRTMPGGLTIPTAVKFADTIDPERRAMLARFEYSVPAWLKKLLDDVIESMLLMDVKPIPNNDPDSAEFRDHFFLELVLRLTQDVPFETTAGFLGEAMAEFPASDPGTRMHNEAFEEAIRAFVWPHISAERARLANASNGEAAKA